MPIFIAPNSAPSHAQTLGLGYRAVLLGGDAGTEQTIKVMRQLVDAALSNAEFIRQAVDIARSVPAYDDFGEVRALYTWVQRNIRYTKDPVTKEKLYPPLELLKIRAGDCDDVSMLLGALCLAIGYPARLVTVAANPQNPQEFSHVYVEAEVPPGTNHWVPLDVARPDAEFGIEPPFYYRKRAWSLMDDSYQDMKGATRLCGLAGVVAMRGLGDGIDWGSILQQSLQEVPAIISTAAGGNASLQNKYGSVVTSSPYGSFVTPLTPGYGIPPAGYSSVGVQTTGWFSTNWPWLVVGAFALMAFGGRRS